MLTTQPTPDQCATEIIEAVPHVIRFMRAEVRRQGKSMLSLPQFRVLRFLERSPHASLTDAAEELDVACSTMSAMIERLVQRGLVSRVDDPHERRRVVLTLTPAGAAYVQQVSDATRSSVAQMLARLPHSQLQQMMQGLVLLKDVFSEPDAS